ncbi:MAG: hypothetical protein F6K47_00590 [Symploca sp. SIO2E6]|nr:hypothetical protein [Symploca sp. SIO2E6]
MDDMVGNWELGMGNWELRLGNNRKLETGFLVTLSTRDQGSDKRNPVS